MLSNNETPTNFLSSVKPPRKPIQFSLVILSKHQMKGQKLSDFKVTRRTVEAMATHTGSNDSNLLMLIEKLVEARLAQKGRPKASGSAAAKAVAQFCSTALEIEWLAHEKRLAKMKS